MMLALSFLTCLAVIKLGSCDITSGRFHDLFSDDERSSISSKSRLRREIRDVPTDEWNRIVKAMNIMKTLDESEGQLLYGSDYRNYNNLVCQHLSASVSSVYGDIPHYSAAFFPWHRAFLITFENSLIAIDDNIKGLPYWDYGIDELKLKMKLKLQENQDEDGNNSNYDNYKDLAKELFNDVYFGDLIGNSNNDYCMNTGPFSEWSIASNPSNYGCGHLPFQQAYNYLRGPSNDQNKGCVIRYGPENVVTQENVNDDDWTFIDLLKWEECLESDTYDNIQSFFECEDLAIHAKPHYSIGGYCGYSMNYLIGDYSDLEGSPNDPIFMFHHANLDRYLYHWQLRNYQNKFNTDEKYDYYGYSKNLKFINTEQNKNVFYSNDGRELFDSLNEDYPFKNILKYNDNTNRIYLKDEELTFGNIIEFTNILNENFIYDSVLYEILSENELSSNNKVNFKNRFSYDYASVLAGNNKNGGNLNQLTVTVQLFVGVTVTFTAFLLLYYCGKTMFIHSSKVEYEAIV